MLESRRDINRGENTLRYGIRYFFSLCTLGIQLLLLFMVASGPVTRPLLLRAIDQERSEDYYLGVLEYSHSVWPFLLIVAILNLTMFLLAIFPYKETRT